MTALSAIHSMPVEAFETARARVETDGDLARLWGISQAVISEYRRRNKIPAYSKDSRNPNYPVGLGVKYRPAHPMIEEQIRRQYKGRRYEDDPRAVMGVA